MRRVLVLLLAACSEYEFGKTAEVDERPAPAGDTAHGADSAPPEDTSAPPTEECNGADDDGDGETDEGFPDTDADGSADCVEVEECDGLDNDGDGGVDEEFDTNGNGLADCLEEEVYCTPFDDFSGWSYVGTGDWYVESGMLTEGRNGLYSAVAWVSDLGTYDHFLIQVDVAWGPTGNDTTGLVWGLDGGSLFATRWDDPQDFYDRYTPTGAMDVSSCGADGSSCAQLVVDSSADLYWPEDLSFATWTVEVDGDHVLVTVNTTVALDATVPEVAGSGPGVVGVYSNDNDGGVWYDNFCVWVEG